EIVLERSTPAPDRRMIARVPAPVGAGHLILGIGPDRARFRNRLPLAPPRRVELIAPAPAAPVRTLRIAEPRVDQVEKGRRVSLHHVFDFRVLLSQRTLAPDVTIQPGVRDQRIVRADEAAVKMIAADAA